MRTRPIPHATRPPAETIEFLSAPNEIDEPRTLLSAVTWTGAAGDNNWDTAWRTGTQTASPRRPTTSPSTSPRMSFTHGQRDRLDQQSHLNRTADDLGRCDLNRRGFDDRQPSQFSGGTLTGTGDVGVSGLVTLTAGTLSVRARSMPTVGYDQPAGGHFNLDGRTINNAAGETATWNGSHRQLHRRVGR